MAGICAGALVLARAGLLRGRRATHGYTAEHATAEVVACTAPIFEGIRFERADVVVDPPFITAQYWAARGLPPAQMQANLDQILQRLRARGTKVLLAGMMAPPNLGREYADAFAEVFRTLATKHGVALYPFFLDGVAAIPRLNQADGIHPNPAGVEVLVERLLPPVRQLLAG